MGETIRYTRRGRKGTDESISAFGRVDSWCKDNRKSRRNGSVTFCGAID